MTDEKKALLESLVKQLQDLVSDDEDAYRYLDDLVFDYLGYD